MTNNKPDSSNSSTVAVIMPTYNRAHVIGRAIQSLLSQTFADFEPIVIDDGSTDDTEVVVRSFNDPRIRYLRHGRNKGAAAARNSGICASRAPYVAFMDSDDEWLPEKLEKQLQVFKATDLGQVGVVVCGRKIIEHHGCRQVVPSSRGWARKDLLALRGNISNINMLIKRSEAGQELWFDETLGSSEEWDLQLRLSAICQFDFTPEILVHKYEVSNDRVYIGENIPRWHAVILQRYEEELQTMPEVMARQWGGVGLTFWMLGHGKEARQAVLRALTVRPWALRFHLYFLCALTGKIGLRVWQALRRVKWQLT